MADSFKSFDDQRIFDTAQRTIGEVGVSAFLSGDNDAVRNLTAVAGLLDVLATRVGLEPSLPLEATGFDI